MLRGDHPVRRQQREGAAAGALPEQEAQRRRRQDGEVRERSRDLAGESALLGLLAERGAGGVDHRDERQPELGGQPHAAASLPQAGGAERAGEAGAAVLAEQHAGRGAEPREREQQARIGLALAGAVEGDDGGGRDLQQRAHAGVGPRAASA